MWVSLLVMVTSAQGHASIALLFGELPGLVTVLMDGFDIINWCQFFTRYYTLGASKKCDQNFSCFRDDSACCPVSLTSCARSSYSCLLRCPVSVSCYPPPLLVRLLILVETCLLRMGDRVSLRQMGLPPYLTWG